MISHFEESLQRDMDLIRRKVIEMGNLAERALKASLQALIKSDRKNAYSVILRDQYIDELEKELDRLCLEFLVRQQPVAGQLRFVYAVIKINNELERIGDYAESIARHTLTVTALSPLPPFDRFVEIANISIPMLRNAMQAFIDQNQELALATLEMEDRVDTIRNTINSELVHLREAGRLPLEALAPLMLIASRFERVADQSCNICEEVLYMCTGKYIKHQGVEVFRILFVDEGNASTSLMAEAIGNRLGISKFIFSSAGITPKPIDPGTVSFLQEKGVDISRQSSKYVNQIVNLEHYQVIVALSETAQTAFPPPPTKTVSIPWEVQDPSQAQGTPEEVHAVYEKTYSYLETHIRDLVQAILGDNMP
ncbi:phosphate signaling complex protein PhoU [bacterium]|nr:phosphate signaling complex protein PhoU [bacterium]RIK74120.1 MAG: phosphate transport system regulatory protein PhoU [candidate division KSB1 bacterium]